jgi:hypothetical protein
MPPLPNAGKVIRCDLFFTVGANTRVRDRIFFSYAGAGPAVADLNTLAGTISAAWNTNMAPQVNTGVTLTGITLTDLASASGAQVVTSQARVGTLVGTAMTAATAMVIKFKVARRYRGGHPRFYLPGRVIADLATSVQWAAGSVTNVVTAWTAFIAACVLAPPAPIGVMTHANVSYFLGFTNTTFPTGRTRAVPRLRAVPVVDAVTSYSGNQQIGSQRRRSQQSA